MLKKILLIIFLIAIVLAMGSILFVYIYRDELKSYTAHQINEQLNTNLSEENFELNFFQGFPYAAVEVKDLKRETVTETEQDYIFLIGTLSVYFHIPDLIFNKFNIKKIKLEDALIRIFDSDRDPSEEAGLLSDLFARESEMKLNLKNATLKNVKLIFEEGQNQKTIILLNQLGLHAFWREEKRLLDIEGTFSLHLWEGAVPVFESGELDTRLALDYFPKEGSYQVISGFLKSPGLPFYLNGTSLGKDFLKLQLTTDQLDLNKVQNSELVKKYVDLEDISLTGKAAVNATVESWFFSGNTPYISGDFDLEKAAVKTEQSNFIFEDIQGTGNFSNGPTRNLHSAFISLNKAEMQYGDSRMRIRLRLEDLLAPLIHAEVSGKISVEKLIRDIGTDHLPLKLSGNPEVNIKWKRQRPGWGPLELQDILYSKTNGEINLDGLKGVVGFYPLPFEIVNGKLLINNNDLKLKDLLIKTDNSRLVLNSSVQELFSYLLFKEEPLTIRSEINSEYADIEELLSVEPETAAQKENFDYPPVIFENILQADSLAWGDFLATEISSHVDYGKDELRFGETSLQAFGGSIDARGKLLIRDDHYTLEANGKMAGVDISRLFRELSDFNQQQITHENLSGILDAELNFTTDFNKTLQPLLSSISLKSNFEIQDGHLKNYKPLMESLKFLNDDSLKDIKFLTLKNHIKIQDQIIHIPQMEINSNVIDLEGYGTHSFDNEIDYHFKILLSELLSHKARNRKNEFEEYGYIEDDGLGKASLYFHLTGTADEFQFKYDKKAVRKKIIADFKKESQKIKEDFSEEFKWLKRDPEKTREHEEMKEYFETQERGNFILEWENEPDTSINK
ncbi:MAG: hypothetical protein K9G67_10845 [Bacteroidales bacterium]|nr:hypothetical protein [Bacteroidales bacterium]MCF8344913.1 hypothetical protein [Bacteroidales bacterium]MCF8350676.1 hypothetical protein [Bacteroidales bacterium]MCF8376842.1 hypothetical protein [Bacteroidales bacterium]MCF8400749.1 hypothetical protein [Bacteroidales bacterium]